MQHKKKDMSDYTDEDRNQPEKKMFYLFGPNPKKLNKMFDTAKEKEQDVLW